MSSLCTSFVNSAEQNSSLDVSWASSFVTLPRAAISVRYSILAIKKDKKRILEVGSSFELSPLPRLLLTRLNEKPVFQAVLRS